MKPLPNRVEYCMGLYTRKRSDLFIDDLTPDELRMIADHLEEQQKKKPQYRAPKTDIEQYAWNIEARKKGF